MVPPNAFRTLLLPLLLTPILVNSLSGVSRLKLPSAFSGVHSQKNTPFHRQRFFREWRNVSPTTSSSLAVSTADTNSGTRTVDRLLDAIDVTNSVDVNDETIIRTKREEIRSLIQILEASFRTLRKKSGNDDDDDASSSSSSGPSSRFDPVLGLYDVIYTQPIRDGDNPVGGKWTRNNGLAQRLLRTRNTYQHILPFNTTGLSSVSSSSSSQNTSDVAATVAEAVNVITLEALFRLIRLTIILRGDAVPLTSEERTSIPPSDQLPLSDLAVRAYFDPPRIVFGKQGRILNVNLGPRTRVVLDATYVDDKIRLGRGGRGTRFVFRRCDESGDEEANEFRYLLARRPLRRSRALSILISTLGFGLYLALGRSKMRLVGFGVAAMSGLGGLTMMFSTGGIERDD